MAKILVVEDSPDNMKLFLALLTFRGHEVRGMITGEHLLETIASFRPDLVLMDIQLPGQDGFALLHAIRSSAYRDLPVVALTAHAMAGDRDRALEAGFEEHITKPIDVNNFPQQIAHVLQRPRGTGIA